MSAGGRELTQEGFVSVVLGFQIVECKVASWGLLEQVLLDLFFPRISSMQDMLRPTPVVGVCLNDRRALVIVCGR